MPDWVANKAARLERIRAAKVTLEAETRIHACPHHCLEYLAERLLSRNRPWRLTENVEWSREKIIGASRLGATAPHASKPGCPASSSVHDTARVSKTTNLNIGP
jgi:hypothetical protein